MGVQKGAGATLSRSSKLFEAIIANDLPRVKQLVARGADVNSIYMNETPLMSTTNREIIKFLLQSGADVNLQVSGGSTAAHHAAVQHDDSILLILIGAKINMNVCDQNGRTPLMWASRWSAVMNIQNIIYYGIKGKLEGVEDFNEYINARDNEGKSAIDMISIDFSDWDGWRKTIRKILRNGGATDVTIENVGFLPIAVKGARPVNVIMYEQIQDNDDMINFNGEYNRGRYYKKSTFDMLPDPKKNPHTGIRISRAKTYKAKLIKNKSRKNNI